MASRNPRYLSISQMAASLGVSRFALYRAVHEGRLRCVVPYGQERGWLVPAEEVRRFEREELEEVTA